MNDPTELSIFNNVYKQLNDIDKSVSIVSGIKILTIKLYKDIGVRIYHIIDRFTEQDTNIQLKTLAKDTIDMLTRLFTQY